MLPQKFRLKTKEIGRVFKKGKSYKGKFLILKLAKNNLSFSRFAFIVPLNLSKKSTKRNEFKRRAQESLGQKIKSLKTGFDGVFIALPGALEKNYNEIEGEIEKLLHLANIYE